jgi:FixJ family two-component response regulator
MRIPKGKNSEALIAIVDDDQSFREALQSLLALIGFLTAILGYARDFLDSPQIPDVSCSASRCLGWMGSSCNST